MRAASRLPAGRGKAPTCAEILLTCAAELAPVPQLELLATTAPPANTVMTGSERTAETPKEDRAGPTPRISTVLDALPEMTSPAMRVPLPGVTFIRAETLTSRVPGALPVS